MQWLSFGNFPSKNFPWILVSSLIPPKWVPFNDPWVYHTILCSLEGFLVSCQVGSYKKVTQPTVDGSEIRLTTWDVFETQWDIYHINSLAGFLPSTVLQKSVSQNLEKNQRASRPQHPTPPFRTLKKKVHSRKLTWIPKMMVW